MTEQRTALVTGASSGIGRAIALRLAAKGIRVGLVARRKDRLKGVTKAIEASGGTAMTFPGDVRDRQLAPAVVQGIVQKWGRLDILVNNAGIGRYAPVDEFPEDSFREQFDTNVFAPFLFTKAAVPLMKSRSRDRS